MCFCLLAIKQFGAAAGVSINELHSPSQDPQMLALWKSKPIVLIPLTISPAMTILDMAQLRTHWIDAQEWAARKLDRAGNQPSAPHLRTGHLGERATLFELRRRGYLVVARRWTSTRIRGDIDLVAWQGENLCFIEVKTRSSRHIIPAEAAVDEEKRRVLRRLARAYLRSFPEKQRNTISTRFEVVSVYLVSAEPQFDFFPGAFGWD
jgi:putative endonuclease